jgi:hypothetical protein
MARVLRSGKNAAGTSGSSPMAKPYGSVQRYEVELPSALAQRNATEPDLRAVR